MNYAGMSATIPKKAAEGVLPVTVNISNLGANSFMGSIEIDAGFYSNISSINLDIGENKSLSFEIPTLMPGAFNATIKLLHNGNILEEDIGEFVVFGPEFTVTNAPDNPSFGLGENVNLSFGVLNKGGMEGKAGLNLTIPGIYEDVNNSWLTPGEEKNLSFSFTLPDDLEEKSYKFLFGFNGDMQEGSLFIKGANITVEAALDKPFYQEGDTAVLTLLVKNNHDFDLPLFSRVKFNDYDNLTHFNLSGSGSESLSFNVPVHFTGDKIFYSVYMASGRSLYINSMYAYEKPKDDSGITLYTNKQVYYTGENINVFVNVTRDGTLNMTAPGLITTRSLTAGDSTVISFTLPELKSGTYYIGYTFGNFSSSYPFDVDGYSAKILEFTLDKELYDIGDTMNMKMLVEANRDFAGTVKMGVYGNSAEDSFEFDREFVKGENRVEVSRTLSTSWSGIHSTVYSIYTNLAGGSVLLASGAEYFDVVDHMPPLITITSPQNIEYTTSSVPLIFTVEDTSDIEWIGYSLDGAENTTISGSTLLTDLVNGNHAITVYARDSAGNTGSASASFMVNVGQEDTMSPIITITAPEARDYLHSENITLNFTATDTLSGIDSIEASLDSMSVTNGQMIDLRTLALGQHTLVVSATDKVGNNASESVKFNINPVPAAIDVKPDTLNKASRSDKNAVTVYIEILGYDVNAINVSTVTLNTPKGSVSAQLSPTEIGDYDGDGILDRMLKFDRQAVIAIVDVGDKIKIVIRGKIAEAAFEGSDEICVIEQGKK